MNCIRCGRRIPEGQVFCEDCAGVVDKPLRDSPYMSKHITLPERRPEVPGAAPAPAKKAQQKKTPSPFRRKLHRMTAAVVLLAIFCAALLGACGYGVYFYFGRFQQERNRLRVQEEELNRRAVEVGQMQVELVDTRDALSTAQQELSDRDRTITKLEQELNIYRMQNSETELSIRELQEDNLRLVQENSDAAKQLDEWIAKAESLTTQLGTVTKERDRLVRKSDFVDEHVAFIENDGTGYYHVYSCSHFKEESYWAFSVNLAISRGYTACPYCH